MRVRHVVRAVGGVGAALLVACSSSSTGGTTGDAGGDAVVDARVGDGGGGSGSRCPALRDKQAAANCPQFDPNKYLTECEATESSASPACRSKLDAYADCVLGQPIGCTDAGTINDDTPPACQTQADDLGTACK